MLLATKEDERKMGGWVDGESKPQRELAGTATMIVGKELMDHFWVYLSYRNRLPTISPKISLTTISFDWTSSHHCLHAFKSPIVSIELLWSCKLSSLHPGPLLLLLDWRFRLFRWRLTHWTPGRLRSRQIFSGLHWERIRKNDEHGAI